HRDRLEKVAQTLSARSDQILIAPADLTSADDRRRLMETVTAQWQGLEVVLNIAGIGSFGHFAESSEAVLRQIMEVNFFAPAELIRLAIPHLRRGDQPAIVNVSSMCGRRALPAWPEYSASKFALCGLSESLRAELVRFGIDVLVILPGLTRTEIGTHLLRNEGRMQIDYAAGMDPEAVARQILRALQRNRNETVLGREARMILCLNRLMPRLVDRLMARKVKQ